MNIETEALITVLHERMENMTEQERVELLYTIASDYCQKCGSDNGGMHCQCDNDD